MTSITWNLLVEFLSAYPFQPATALWRAEEIGGLLALGFPAGLGLDLGCGDGKVMQLILGHVGPRELVGLDADPGETRLAAATGVYKRIHTAASSAIPEGDSQFDFVFSNCVLEHIADTASTLREVSRALKAGGIFLFTVPSSDFRACLGGPLLPWVTREQYLRNLDRRLDLVHCYTRQEWMELLRSAGLEVEIFREFLAAPSLRRWENIARFTAGVFYELFFRGKSPIEIQRALHMRKESLHLPKPLAKIAAAVVSAGLPRAPVGKEQKYGGLIVLARKAAPPNRNG